MSRIELQKRAVLAFAKGNNLNARKREVLSRSFRGKMTFARATVITRNYALGGVQEEGESLLKLTHAWLVLGERMFQVIFHVVKACKEAVSRGAVVLEHLIDEIKSFLPVGVSVTQVSEQIEVVKASFEDEVVLAV